MAAVQTAAALAGRQQPLLWPWRRCSIDGWSGVASSAVLCALFCLPRTGADGMLVQWSEGQLQLCGLYMVPTRQAW
jgi:hypothetical protein